MKRVGISKKDRFEVFKRDGFVCQYCGSHPPDVILEVDHILAVAEGGCNDEENLITACFDCNRGKGKRALSSIPKSLGERAAEILEREEQLGGYRDAMQERNDRIENDLWSVASVLDPGSAEKGMKRDWLISIKMFNKKLDLDEVIEAAEIAYSRRPYSTPQRFKYFCGVCWNKIRGAEK